MKLKDILTIRISLIMIGYSSLMNLNGQNLEKHKWENRILIVKTSDIKSKKYQEQLKEFGNKFEELIDRKIILYKITGDDFVLIDYKNSELNDSGKISGKLTEDILNEKENFEVILIGLDGGIKLQQTEILMKEDLFKIIDKMPMRRDELIGNEIKD
ncbi:MAG: DUF4174 domain-containing protein [Flavobacteriaceae bacterium]|nr:DUF4174 domain-containing protein [Flavobacteriaceae bacterium]